MFSDTHDEPEKWQNRWAPDILKNIVKPRSLVLWHYVTAWGFFYVLSPCNTPKQQMPKRPKLRINQGIWGDKDGSEVVPWEWRFEKEVTEKTWWKVTDRRGWNEKPARKMTFKELVTFRRNLDQWGCHSIQNPWKASTCQHTWVCCKYRLSEKLNSTCKVKFHTED